MEDEGRHAEKRRVIPVLNAQSLVVGMLCALSFAGCTVGPDFHKPEAPDVNTYTKAPLPEKTSTAPGAGGEAQRFAFGEEIPDQWWALFHSEALDRLIRRGLEKSPTLASARAALRQAKENLAAQTGVTLFPSVDTQGSVTREKFSGAAFGQPGQGTILTLYNASVNV
ncbi:MAG: TolC family protein, partial [Acidobacteriota bacterium]